MRNEERRHHNRGNEVRSTQRGWVDAHTEPALIERDEEVNSAPNVEHQNHRGRKPCARGERPYGQNRENGRKDVFQLMVRYGTNDKEMVRIRTLVK